jgi:pimeloyl-ACP methyl ester carboxylesterase
MWAAVDPDDHDGSTVLQYHDSLAAVLDNWDPWVVDGIAARHRVITFDNRGVGAAQGRTPISVTAFRNQLKAIHTWGRQQPSGLTVIRQPVLAANGDHDRMVPSSNSADLARHLPNARLKLYPDAGHGGIFQYHAEFVDEALKFLEAWLPFLTFSL